MNFDEETEPRGVARFRTIERFSTPHVLAGFRKTSGLFRVQNGILLPEERELSQERGPEVPIRLPG